LVLVEHEHKQWSAKKSGGEVVAVCLDILRQAIDHVGAKRWRCDAGEERGEVRSL
jgi:hypothetical protein